MEQASNSSAQFANERSELATFEAGGSEYAIDVSHIREIVRWQEVTPLPRAPSLIEGVIDLRAGVIPVIDLGRALGHPAIEKTSDARIVIVEIDDLLLGIRVQAAIEVLSPESTHLDPPPALATQAGYDAVRAVVRRPNAKPVLVLSMDHLLESIYRSGVDPGAAEK